MMMDIPHSKVKYSPAAKHISLVGLVFLIPPLLGYLSVFLVVLFRWGVAETVLNYIKPMPIVFQLLLFLGFPFIAVVLGVIAKINHEHAGFSLFIIVTGLLMLGTIMIAALGAG